MRKTKIIAAVTALAMMCMGVGYSYWSQTIPISVSGTLARFQVNVASASALDAEGNDYNSDTYAYAQHTTRDATLVACRMNAGDSRKFYVTFSNVGDVKATLSQVVIHPDSGGGILSNVTVSIDGYPPITLDQNHTISLGKDIALGKSAKILITITLAENTVLSEDRTPFSFKIDPTFIQ